MREDKLPLRVILQNFINHVETLENAKEENERDEKYEHEFQVSLLFILVTHQVAIYITINEKIKT